MNMLVRFCVLVATWNLLLLSLIGKDEAVMSDPIQQGERRLVESACLILGCPTTASRAEMEEHVRERFPTGADSIIVVAPFVERAASRRLGLGEKTLFAFGQDHVEVIFEYTDSQQTVHRLIVTAWVHHGKFTGRTVVSHVISG